MSDPIDPNPGDLVEFFDGEGFVSGTMMERESDDDRRVCLRVGSENQRVHETDLVAIIARKENRETDLPLLEERFRTEL
jgi:hypothetical protein